MLFSDFAPLPVVLDLKPFNDRASSRILRLVNKLFHGKTIVVAAKFQK
jgi:hypothetical protein